PGASYGRVVHQPASLPAVRFARFVSVIGLSWTFTPYFPPGCDPRSQPRPADPHQRPHQSRGAEPIERRGPKYPLSGEIWPTMMAGPKRAATAGGSIHFGMGQSRIAASMTSRRGWLALPMWDPSLVRGF